MTQHVGGDEYVFGEAVTCSQVGVAGFVRKHDLEQAGVAHMPLDEAGDVALRRKTSAGMRTGNPYTAILHHEAVRDGFEFDWMKFETRTSRQLLDPLRCNPSSLSVIANLPRRLQRFSFRTEEMSDRAHTSSKS